MNVDRDKEIQALSRQIPATYYLFDILHLDGKNLQNLSFLQRRKFLSDIIETNDKIRISEYIEEFGIEMFEKIKSMNLEGIIAKNISSKYLQGTRPASIRDNWLLLLWLNYSSTWSIATSCANIVRIMHIYIQEQSSHS
jgi:ATP-dependent DNA ligase